MAVNPVEASSPTNLQLLFCCIADPAVLNFISRRPEPLENKSLSSPQTLNNNELRQASFLSHQLDLWGEVAHLHPVCSLERSPTLVSAPSWSGTIARASFDIYERHPLALHGGVVGSCLKVRERKDCFHLTATTIISHNLMDLYADSGSNTHVFKDRSFCHNVRKLLTPTTTVGVGGVCTMTHVGSLNLLIPTVDGDFAKLSLPEVHF